MRSLVWFRGKDLRLTDHGPLHHGLSQGEVILLFVIDPFFFSAQAAARMPHRMQFLLASVRALQKNVADRGGELLLTRGSAVEEIPRLAALWRVDQVLAQRWSEPFGRQRDGMIKHRLHVPLRLFEGETLLPPESVRTQGGTAFSVYTPFAQAARNLVGQLAQLPAPRRLPLTPADVDRNALLNHPPALSDLQLEENVRVQSGGEAQARQRLKSFLSVLDTYQDQRDQLGQTGTSRISADLKFGTLSVREVYRKVQAAPPSPSRARFLSQLLWREFAYACLWDRPELLFRPFRRDFERFPWSRDEGLLDAWATGHTGYPIVDAAARQLLSEGYVHNRARMISASFLTKHLLVHYRCGEAHYLRHLTDGDWAINNLGWQWSAGCGVDAQPYFRVFNPVTQGAKFDAQGTYVRKYLPELSQLPNKYIHAPWLAPSSVLSAQGVRLGANYPEPIVEHKEARARFLSVASSHLKRRE